MYSFAQRGDVRVVDEPLYGHYLRVSGADHPGRQEVLDAMDCDGNRVMRTLLERQEADTGKRLFMKHMAHHLVEIDLTFLQATENIFLVRDPREMLPSLTIQLPRATLADTGLKRQWELYSELRHSGMVAAILDAHELLRNPASVLQSLCEHLQLDYDPAMLCWSAGPREEDGVWAPHWYHAVHKSTGFAPFKAKTRFPSRLLALLDECKPWYDKLFEHAIRANAQEN